MIVRARRTALAALCLTIAMAVSAVACAAKSSRGPDRAVVTSEEGAFRPESIRVHPLTRVVERDGEQLVIEAHVELFDAWGHPVKGRGLIRFAVSPLMPGGIGDTDRDSGASLRAEIDLRDPDAASVKYYDSATRTYRLFLEGLTAVRSAPLSLTVTFIGLDDRVMRDTYSLGQGPRLSEPESTPENESGDRDSSESRPEGED